MQMKERGEMTYEERLEAAERHRLKGNALFLQVRHILGEAGGCMSLKTCHFILVSSPLRVFSGWVRDT